MVIAVLIFSFVLSYLIVIPIRDSRKADGKILEVLEESVDTRNIYARINSVLLENMSYRGNDRKDAGLKLKRDISIETVKEKRDKEYVSGRDWVNFSIDNATPIMVDIYFSPKDPKKNYYYEVNFFHQGEHIDFPSLDERKDDDFSFIIPEDFTYSGGNTFKYGDYSIVLDVVNGTTNIDVVYERLMKRDILITEEDDKYIKELNATITRGEDKVMFKDTKSFSYKE